VLRRVKERGVSARTRKEIKIKGGGAVVIGKMLHWGRRRGEGGGILANVLLLAVITVLDA
jgi:hypothetical protein